MNYDFVVVGSGGAGLSAALAAAVGGARVAVLERSSLIGGTTAISGGGLWLPGNQFMEEQGTPDDVDKTTTYIRRLTLGRTSEDVIQAYVDTAPGIVPYLREHTAIELEATDTPDYRTNLPGAAAGGRQVATGLYDSARLGEMRSMIRASPAPAGMPPIRHGELQLAEWGRGDQAKSWVQVAAERDRDGIFGRGRALVGSLVEACARLGVEFVVNARAVRLLQENGRVTGVVADTEDGEAQLGAKLGVMLASGGFEWNPRMWNDAVGSPLEGPLSPPFNVGDGIRMGVEAGARLGNMTEVWWMPALAVPGEEYEGKPRVRIAQQDKALPGAIVVNRAGRRFGNEAMNYNDFGRVMAICDPHTQTYANVPAYVVFDGDHFNRYLPIKDADEAVEQGWLFKDNTLKGLAEKIAVDPRGLEKQVAEFNPHAEKGLDPAFGRGQEGWEQYRADPGFVNGTLGPLAAAPYYAYKLNAGCFGTKGGVVTDKNGQVVDFSDNPIAGLYASGNVASAVFASAYPGGGATLGPATVFGHLAGRHATAA